MDISKKNYYVLLNRLARRQEESGLTDLEVANWLGIKPVNYKRLISGAYPMTYPRLEQLCSLLGFSVCLVDKEMLESFKKCVEEEFADIAEEDGN